MVPNESTTAPPPLTDIASPSLTFMFNPSPTQMNILTAEQIYISHYVRTKKSKLTVPKDLIPPRVDITQFLPRAQSTLDARANVLRQFTNFVSSLKTPPNNPWSFETIASWVNYKMAGETSKPVLKRTLIKYCGHLRTYLKKHTLISTTPLTEMIESLRRMREAAPKKAPALTNHFLTLLMSGHYGLLNKLIASIAIRSAARMDDLRQLEKVMVHISPTRTLNNSTLVMIDNSYGTKTSRTKPDEIRFRSLIYLDQIDTRHLQLKLKERQNDQRIFHESEIQKHIQLLVSNGLQGHSYKPTTANLLLKYIAQGKLKAETLPLVLKHKSNIDTLIPGTTVGYTRRESRMDLLTAIGWREIATALYDATCQTL